jgi:NAD(P)-dependent dehydrogenase (short-subunit alcohol dehydrogenase family)
MAVRGPINEDGGFDGRGNRWRVGRCLRSGVGCGEARGHQRLKDHIMPLDGTTFVITGGARGIGADTGRLAASRGARVVLSDVLVEDGEAVAAEINADGGDAIFVEADLTDDDAVVRLMETAANHYGGLDVLHNNAGIHEAMITPDFVFEDMSLDTFDRVMAVNLRAPFVCAKAATPYLKQSTRSPSIITAGSTGSLVGYPSGLAYGTSKGGVAQLTKNLAVALAPYGIRSNCYCPASVDTEMPRQVGMATTAGGDPSRGTGSASTHLVGRVGEVRDISELVCYLASEEASFVNGVVWPIDGGAMAWRGTIDQLGMA